MGRWRPVDFELSLAANLINRCLIGELGYELVGLNINVLLAWGRLGRFDISGEELLGGLGSLLLQPLWVVLALVGLKQLVRVRPSWDHHRCVGASSEDTLIVHDILWVVLLFGIVSVRVLVLVFLGNHARMGREALPS